MKKLKDGLVFTANRVHDLRSFCFGSYFQWFELFEFGKLALKVRTVSVSVSAVTNLMMNFRALTSERFHSQARGRTPLLEHVWQCTCLTLTCTSHSSHALLLSSSQKSLCLASSYLISVICLSSTTSSLPWVRAQSQQRGCDHLHPGQGVHLVENSRSLPTSSSSARCLPSSGTKGGNIWEK